MTDCVRQTLKSNGLRGPFQGLGATTLRDTPAFGIYFGTFELVKSKLAEYQGIRREELGAREPNSHSFLTTIVPQLSALVHAYF